MAIRDFVNMIAGTRDAALVHDAATLGIVATKDGQRGGSIVFRLAAGEVHEFKAVGRRAARDFLRAVAFADESAKARARARHVHLRGSDRNPG